MSLLGHFYKQPTLGHMLEFEFVFHGWILDCGDGTLAERKKCVYFTESSCDNEEGLPTIW